MALLHSLATRTHVQTKQGRVAPRLTIHRIELEHAPQQAVHVGARTVVFRDVLRDLRLQRRSLLLQRPQPQHRVILSRGGLMEAQVLARRVDAGVPLGVGHCRADLAAASEHVPGHADRRQPVDVVGTSAERYRRAPEAPQVAAP
eukprot:1037158-Prymnesium_polylepis.1